MTPTLQQWEVYRLCHPDHQGMCVAEAAKEMGVTPEEAEEAWWRMKLWYPELFSSIDGDGNCPGGLICVNVNKHTGKPKIERYGPDVDGRVKQKF